LPIEPGAGRRSRLLAVLLAALVLAGCSGGGYTWGWHVVSPLTEQGQGNIAFLAGGLWRSASRSRSA
jgi:polar amino acid transport system permease protein